MRQKFRVSIAPIMFATFDYNFPWFPQPVTLTTLESTSFGVSKDLPGLPSKRLAAGEPPKSPDVTKSLCVTHSFFTVQKPRAKVPPVLFESKKGNRACARNILSPLNAAQQRVITNSPRLNSPRYTTKSQRQFTFVPY